MRDLGGFFGRCDDRGDRVLEGVVDGYIGLQFAKNLQEGREELHLRIWLLEEHS